VLQRTAVVCVWEQWYMYTDNSVRPNLSVTMKCSMFFLDSGFVHRSNNNLCVLINGDSIWTLL
jgi:hypothetical protein